LLRECLWIRAIEATGVTGLSKCMSIAAGEGISNGGCGG
jgi:hypothetical protein